MIFRIVFLVYVSLLNSVSCKTVCDQSAFSSSDLNPGSWKNVPILGPSGNYCFGNPKGQILLYSKQINTGTPNKGHHSALLCRLGTTQGSITAGAIMNIDKSSANFVEIRRNWNESVFGANGQTSAQGVNLKVTFWGTHHEEPTMNCVGFDAGKAQCGDFHESNLSGSNTC